MTTLQSITGLRALPLHDEPVVVFDKNGFTVAQNRAYIDHWKKID